MRRLSMKGKRKSETNTADDDSEENGGSVSNAGSVEDVKESETMTKGKRKASKNKSNGKQTEDDTEAASNDDEQSTGSRDQENGNAKGAKRRKKEMKNKPTTSQQNNTEEDEENNEEYEVEKIVAHRTIKGRRQFLVRWKGYEADSDTWEQEKDLNCPQLIDDFLADEESKQEAQESARKQNNSPKNKQPKTEKKEKKRGRPSNSQNQKDGYGIENNNEEAGDEKADDDDDEETGDGKEYEVEKVIDVYFKKNKGREFLIRWKGFPPSADTWEPEENLNCPKLIEKFMAKVDKAKASDLRELRANPQHTKRYTLTMMDPGRRLSKRNMDKQRITYHECD